MHLFDHARRFLGGYAIVGETFPIATGAAYWLKMNEAPDAVLCFFGDGAANQGTFHECLNMAALWRLPVVFLCENNHYQIGTEIHRHSAVAEIYRRACAYGMDARHVDGMDVLAVHEATREALRHVRAGNGPYLLMRDLSLSRTFDGRPRLVSFGPGGGGTAHARSRRGFSRPGTA